MARMKFSVNPKTIFDKYTLKQLHEKIKNYNIPNYTKMKKAELTQYLDQKFSLQNEMLILKNYQSQSESSPQEISQQDFFDFNADLFSDFNESQNPLLIQAPAMKRAPPATKGSRKTFPANRKIMPPRPRGRPKKN